MDDNKIKQLLGDEWDDAYTAEYNIKKVVYKLEQYKELGNITGFFLKKFTKWAEDIKDDLGS
jgi:hypothetical protein